MKKLLLIFLILLFSQSNLSAKEPLTEEEEKNINYLIKVFSECQGTYQAWNELFIKGGLPDNAKTFNGLKNGAHAASLYLLSFLRVLKHDPKKDGELSPQTYGVYSPYVNALADAAYNETIGLLELNKNDEAGKILNVCVGMQKAQEEYVNLLRKDVHKLP